MSSKGRLNRPAPIKNSRSHAPNSPAKTAVQHHVPDPGDEGVQAHSLACGHQDVLVVSIRVRIILLTSCQARKPLFIEENRHGTFDGSGGKLNNNGKPSNNGANRRSGCGSNGEERLQREQDERLALEREAALREREFEEQATLNRGAPAAKSWWQRLFGAHAKDRRDRARQAPGGGDSGSRPWPIIRSKRCCARRWSGRRVWRRSAWRRSPGGRPTC